MPSGSPLPPPRAPHSTLGRRLPNPPASSATVLLPAFLPPAPKCSNGSLGPQDPLLPSDGPDWGEAPHPDALLRRSLLAATFFRSSLSFSFPTSSASTSFVSRCTGPRDFARFDVSSLFFPELLCFFKVDLLSRFDCTLECVDHR